MLRKILAIAIVMSGALANAQDKKETNTSKAVSKPAEVDYRVAGSAMPHMLLVTFDTLVKPANEKKINKLNKKATGYQVTDNGAKMITDKHLDNGANLIVMMFNPTCGHCEDQTELFIRNKELFKKTKLVLMANQNMKAYLPDFIKNHHINDNPIITLGYDSTDFIKETFLYQMLPQINIYSSDRKLLKTYSGNVSIDTLSQYIQ